MFLWFFQRLDHLCPLLVTLDGQFLNDLVLVADGNGLIDATLSLDSYGDPLGLAHGLCHAIAGIRNDREPEKHSEELVGNRACVAELIRCPPGVAVCCSRWRPEQTCAMQRHFE